MYDPTQAPPVIYPHVVFDASGTPLRVERILKGVRCQVCPHGADLGLLVKTENSYTLLCPQCGDSTSRPAYEINPLLEAQEKKEAEHEAYKRAAALDDARAAQVSSRKKAPTKATSKKVSKASSRKKSAVKSSRKRTKA